MCQIVVESLFNNNKKTKTYNQSSSRKLRFKDEYRTKNLDHS